MNDICHIYQWFKTFKTTIISSYRDLNQFTSPTDNIPNLCFEKSERKKKNYKCIWIKRREMQLSRNCPVLTGRSVSAALSHPAGLLAARGAGRGRWQPCFLRRQVGEEQLRCPSPNTSCSPLCVRWIVIYGSDLQQQLFAFVLLR